MLELLKRKARAAVISAAAVLVAMQLLLPSFFDLVFDVILLGLVVLMGRLETDQPRKEGK